jgi:hypothetical protein
MSVVCGLLSRPFAGRDLQDQPQRLPEWKGKAQKMRSGALAAVSALLLLGAASTSGLAASACTGWVHLDAGYPDTNLNDIRASQACAQDVAYQARRAGYNGKLIDTTVFFWFGNDVVTARCLSRTVVALAAYHRYNDRACPLLDRIKLSLRRQ